MSFPADFIDRLKDANPIEEIMGNYLNLKRAGRDYICLCPFHSEKTPSCHIHPDKQYFYCFGCHAGGDVITFVMKYNSLDYVDAVQWLADRSGIPMPESSYEFNSNEVKEKKRIQEMNRIAGRFFYSQLKTPEGKYCLEYLTKKRGLSPETIKKYGMGFAPNSWSALKNYMLSQGFSEKELEKASLISRSENNSKKTFDFFVNRAMFPFIDIQGNIVGFGGRALNDSDKRKYLNTKETACYKKEKFLFSLNFAKNKVSENNPIILCEGNLDVISLNQAGFETAVASCGTALTPVQAKLIRRYSGKAIICYDSDNAGQIATSKAVKILNDAGIETKTIYMTGAKDPDEYVRKFGADHFRNLLNKSVSGYEFEFRKCESGLDLETTDGMNEYVNKVCKIIAGIQNPVTRSLYINNLSIRSDIDKRSLNELVDSIMSDKKHKDEKKEEYRMLNRISTTKDTINPDADKHKKEATAECGIIFYLMKNPDSCTDICSKISPENFVTSFNRKVFEFIVNKTGNLEDCSISSFNSEFSPDEVGKITEIIDKYELLDIDEEVLEDYIKVLLNYKDKEIKNDEVQSDDDFLSQVALLRKEKNG